MKKTLILISALGCAGVMLFLSGCARNISSSSYDSRTIGSANDTYEGIVIKVKKVMVENCDSLEDNKTGALMGAVAGGALGSGIGRGSGKVIAMTAGALAGGFGGTMAEKNIKSQEALEYVVRLKSGAMKTVVQGLDNPLYPGQSVLLMIDQRGRSRIVPN